MADGSREHKVAPGSEGVPVPSRSPDLPSGTFETAHIPTHTPGVAGAVAVSREGRNWLGNLGMASAPQFLALLVIAMLVVGGGITGYVGWRMDGIVRQQIEAGNRLNSERVDSVERRVDHCERRHETRDQEVIRENQRQHEERQQAARERERVLDQQKKFEDQIGRLMGILTKLDAKLGKTPDDQIIPDGSR